MNVTGWTQLTQGKMIEAVFSLYDNALFGFFAAILFFVFQVLCYIKTRNFVLMWIVGIFFAGLFLTHEFINVVLQQQSVMFIYGLLILELAGILYFVLFK